MTPDQLRDRIDLHDLAGKLGLHRPGGQGNYKSPSHKDKNPSLSVYQRNGEWRWKDHSGDDGGDCIALVQFVDGCDFHTAMRKLHDLYGLPMDERKSSQPAREKTLVEWIAERCAQGMDEATSYLEGRGIDPDLVKLGYAKRTLGWNTYASAKNLPGTIGHGGPGVAFIIKDMASGIVLGVDTRYRDPEMNGGVKTNSQGEKENAPWCLDWTAFKRANTVYLVESSINAMSVDTCHIPGACAIAIRGTGNARTLDVRPFVGKRVILCLDNDAPNDKGKRPGPEAAWLLYERLTAANIATLLVDQTQWEWNDVNDALQDVGPVTLNRLLRDYEPYAIPGVIGDADKHHGGRPRVFLPAHDFNQYWRYRVKEDFTTFIATRSEDDMGQTKDEFHDLAGFRIASISRVTVASAQSAMSGEEDSQPNTLFSVTVQAPRHGAKLQRRVFQDEHLHNQEHWRRFGPIFKPVPFARLLSILERAADLGARAAVNFVGLAWRDGKVIVNEGPDCYFTDPDKQCPYHNLMFPTGTPAQARRVIEAYQATFKKNAATLLLVWAVGAHLKAFLGFWPHMILQANKGAGKSTLVKRLERTLAFTMFSGQSLNTEFRLLTSISHTSHPVGWEELSARRQDVIDKAVAMLQECYQFTLSRRGSEMTEYLLSAPVLLAGEDVPVRSLLGKVTRTDLTGKKGPIMPEDLPRFPMADWLKWLTGFKRERIREIYEEERRHCLDACRAPSHDDGAVRMAGNYAALLTAWRLLAEYAEIDMNNGHFIQDTITEMNVHIAESSADREPWVWIMEILFSEIDAGRFSHPHVFEDYTNQETYTTDTRLLIRPSHIIDHIAHTSHLRDKWNALPVKSDRVFKRQLQQAGVLLDDGHERRVQGRRISHLTAISLQKLAAYGLAVGIKENTSAYETDYA